VSQHIGAMALIVDDYDRGIAFYRDCLGFALVSDDELGGGKRWVTLAPPGSSETRLLLAKAADANQASRIGNQTGGRVFLFLNTDNFAHDHARYLAAGVCFLEAPRHEAYGTVAVFQDPFGNKWDLIEVNG
jgi:catechol 2,3-dioxygenase-like lactoylglutathione lyase family enzyme